MTTATHDFGQLAKKAAGNWQRFECFAWYGQPDDSENWTIVYTDNRDSGPLDRANAKAIAAELEPFTDGENPDVVSESHNHWAVGHVNGYSIRVYRDGAVTEAFQKWVELQERLDDYPILDESLHSDECTQEECESWESWARRDFERELEKLFDIELDISADSDDVGYWTQSQPELFTTGKPTSEYRYRVENGHAAFCGLWDTLRERSNTYWEEQSSGMYIDVARVAKSAEWSDVRPFVLNVEQYDE